MMMRKFLLALMWVVLGFSDLTGQNFTGSWHGVLNVQSVKLRVIFNIEKTGDSLISTMDSPDQGAMGLPISRTYTNGNELVLSLSSAMIEYKGILNMEGQIEGTLTQAGQSFPLDLIRKPKEEETENKRYQEPQKPYTYREEQVTFRNGKAGINLSGTLTLPQAVGTYPTVVLITGSGPQNRDEELAGHKPFLVLADYLTRQGMAVLRFDDRGVGKSEGVFHEATSEDFASDVAAAIAYLKGRSEVAEIGLIGHSEGGMIAPLVATTHHDLAFIVMLAGTGIPGDEILLSQLRMFNSASEMTQMEQKKVVKLYSEIYQLIKESNDLDALRKELGSFLSSNWERFGESEQTGIAKEDFINAQLAQLCTLWMQFFLRHDPSEVLSKVNCPVLALNGEKDWQVNHQVNLKAIESALMQRDIENDEVRALPGFNHLFQECKTGLVVEYAQIEQTFSPMALNAISEWVLKILLKSKPGR